MKAPCPPRTGPIRSLGLRGGFVGTASPPGEWRRERGARPRDVPRLYTREMGGRAAAVTRSRIPTRPDWFLRTRSELPGPARRSTRWSGRSREPPRAFAAHERCRESVPGELLSTPLLRTAVRIAGGAAGRQEASPPETLATWRPGPPGIRPTHCAAVPC